MAGIDDLIATFMGQSQAAMNEPAAPWQQELLESVNPQKVKRQNIARALAQASTALATTPGNFLQGVSAAASTGANAYLTGKDQAEDQRLKVQQLLGMQAQKDQDRRLSLLFDAIGVGQKGIDNRRAEEEFGLKKEESKARTDYYNRRGTEEETLSPAQVQANRRAARNEIRAERTKLLQMVKDNEITPDEMERRLEETRLEVNEYYGVTDDIRPPAPNRNQIDFFDQGGDNVEGDVSLPDVAIPRRAPAAPTPEVATPAPANTGGIRQPPQAAIDALRKYPERRAEFDAKFGPGAAAAILGN